VDGSNYLDSFVDFIQDKALFRTFANPFKHYMMMLNILYSLN